MYPLDPHISGSAQPKLTKDSLMSLPIWVPSLAEQVEIESHATAKLSLIEPVFERCATSVERLIEYRSALITAAVTGQIPGLR
jgi:type I restriction enzyme S subunit